MHKPKIISKKVPSPGRKKVYAPRTETMKERDPPKEPKPKKKEEKPAKKTMSTYSEMYVGITSGDKCMLVFGAIGVTVLSMMWPVFCVLFG